VALVPFRTGRFFVSGVSSMAGRDGGVDLRLFGVGVPIFDGAGFGGPGSGGAGYDGFAREAARDRWGDGDGLFTTAAVILETKAERADDPFAETEAMLSEMTKELRERFQRFQSQRTAAEEEALSTGDEAARKAALSDAKAAIEAVSLIVRTLEKIDSLQRTLINERAEAERAAGEPDDIEALKAEFDRLVDLRVRERIDGEIARRERARTAGLEGADAGGDESADDGAGRAGDAGVSACAGPGVGGARGP
jgi:hypothetical protein